MVISGMTIAIGIFVVGLIPTFIWGFFEADTRAFEKVVEWRYAKWILTCIIVLFSLASLNLFWIFFTTNPFFVLIVLSLGAVFIGFAYFDHRLLQQRLPHSTTEGLKRESDDNSEIESSEVVFFENYEKSPLLVGVMLEWFLIYVVCCGIWFLAFLCFAIDALQDANNPTPIPWDFIVTGGSSMGIIWLGMVISTRLFRYQKGFGFSGIGVPRRRKYIILPIRK